VVGARVADPAVVAGALADVRPDIVFHLAGAAHVGQSFGAVSDTLATNVRGTSSLFDGLRAHGARARVLVTSSSAVYRPSDAVLTSRRPCCLEARTASASSRRSACRSAPAGTTRSTRWWCGRSITSARARRRRSSPRRSPTRSPRSRPACGRPRSGGQPRRAPGPDRRPRPPSGPIVS